MEKELVSVVIPSYNRKDKLPECLRSVLSQTYSNMEVIVVDDASTDGTEELFENITDPRLHYYRYEVNHGACYARNYGAERSNGNIICFQDSDDIWHKDKLEKQLAYLLKTGADMSFCGMNRVSKDGSHFYYPVHPYEPEKSLENFLTENRASTQTMILHRYVWENLRFDDSFKRYQDWDFAVRAAAAYKLSYLPEALVESEVVEDSISFAVNSYPALLKLYNKHKDLYEKYPAADAVMNRRMGRRIHKLQHKTAALHFKHSFKLSRKWYDLAYYISDSFYSIIKNEKEK